MKHLNLKAKTRTHIGHKAKKLLKEGILPAVVYSKKHVSTPIEINYKEFYHLYKQTGKTSVIDITIDEDKTIPCIVHDMDIHPVKDTPRHIDFLVVNLKEKITTPIPLEFINEAPAIKEHNAVLNVLKDKIEVSALPDKLPESIIVDLSTLTDMDSTITLNDLVGQASDYSFVDDMNMNIVTLTAQKEENLDAEVGSATGGLEEASAGIATEEQK